jgi:CheY-like chemotaxis protein
LVVCDVFMPGLGGLEALRELRRLGPAVKAVMMSAGSAGPGEGPLADALALGAAATLHKPFDVPELLDAVKRVLTC